MNENKFTEYWAQAQICYFKAEAAKGPASKHLWIQMAQDWISLSETLIPQSDLQNYHARREQLEPFLVE